MGPHAMAFSAFWRIFELKKPRKEPKWRYDMSGEHTGPEAPDASGSEHLHLPGRLLDRECSLLSDHEAIKGRLVLVRFQTTAMIIPVHVNSKWPHAILLPTLKASLCFVCVLDIFNTDWGCNFLKKTKEAISIILSQHLHNISVICSIYITSSLYFNIYI